MRKIYKIVCNTCEDQVKQTSVDTCFLTCEFCGEKPVRIIELVEKQNWIPVSEGLPETQGHYLVTDGKVISTGLWFEDREEFFSNHLGNRYITHYQPLPEPPKGEV